MKKLINFTLYWRDMTLYKKYLKGDIKMNRYEIANKLEQMLDSAETAQIMKDIPGYEGRYAITPTG